MIVEFTREELYDLFELALKRNENKPPRQKWGKGGNIDGHFKGLRAEYAVAKIFGTDINREVYGMKGDRGMPDLTLPSGKTAEVKYRDKVGWDFALKDDNPDSFVADVGVLVYPVPGNDSAVEIAGYTTKEDFLKRASVVNYKYGDRLVIEQGHVFPMEWLLKEEFDTDGRDSTDTEDSSVGQVTGRSLDDAG